MKRALILGLGISGVETAKFLAAKKWEVVVHDDSAQKLVAAGKGFATLPDGLLPGKLDLLVLSPGVPPAHPLVVAATQRGVDIAGEMEVAARFIGKEKVIAVTGTNGKSTTVTLIHEMLQRDGRKSALTGNIGEPIIAFVEKGYEFLVVEVSSFQIETLRAMHPDAALILNVSPDHLDRYASYDDYLMTKVQLGLLAKEEGFIVVNGGDEPLCAAAAGIARRAVYFSATGRSDAIWDNRTVSYYGVAVELQKTKLRGEHNVENLMAAMIAAAPFMKKPALMADAAYAFKPLPHRTAPAGTVGGVEFIDDSKGTNVGAVEKSLAGFADRSVVLILGGVDKGGSYQPLRELADRKCRGVVVMGQAAPKILADFEGYLPLEKAGSMADAVEKAYRLAAGDGTVLFSPACSSFDMYANYKERGDDFVKKVKELKKRVEG